MKVLILTCDEFSNLIPVFLRFYKRHWPDNPYKTEIITQTKPIKTVHKVFYAGKSSWSSELISYLKQSSEDKFILILEDYFIRQPVDTKRVVAAEALCRGKVGCVRLNHAPHKYFKRHSIRTNIEGFREYPTTGRFSWTLQIAFWQKKYLLDNLKEGESCWQNEEYGISRLREKKTDWKILWPEENMVDYSPIGLLRKGALEPTVLRWAKSKLTENSREYKILEDQVKRQKDKQCLRR